MPAQNSLLNFLLDIPNIPHDSVPNGITEKENEVVKEYGKPLKFDFNVRDHVDIGVNHG